MRASRGVLSLFVLAALGCPPATKAPTGSGSGSGKASAAVDVVLERETRSPALAAGGDKGAEKAFAQRAVETPRASFAGLRAARLRKAATSYPAAEQRPEAAPLSLTASDGTGLELVSMKVAAVLEGPLAFTELHLTFKNPRPEIIEGRFAITLPPKAAISRLAMKLPQGWMEAEVVERQAARRIYEDFLHRRQDPALLEKKAGNEFSARIFPIPAHGEKEIKISFSQQLEQAKAPYRLPLKGLPALRDLSIRAFLSRAEQKAATTSLGGETLTQQVIKIDKQGYKPDRDFVVEQPVGAPAGLRHQGLAVARIAPQLSAATVKLERLLVLVDSSASRAAGFASQVERLGSLLRALAATQGQALALHLAAFDQTISTIYRGPVGGFGKAQLDALLARGALGASDLHGALRWAAEREGFDRLLLVSDAVPTAGQTSGAELRAAVRALKPRFRRLDLLLVGGLRDEEVAEQLVRGNLAEDGALLDDELAETEQARRLGLATISGVKVSVPGAKWVWPARLDGLQPGDEVLVYADLTTAKLEPGKPLTIELSGGLTQTATVAVAPVKGPLLERAWVRARLARLAAQRDALKGDRDLKEAIDKQIVGLSIKHRVLCDKTALLVLETEWDYQRYRIDRRALADILSVGANGIELLQRKEPVWQQPVPRPMVFRRLPRRRRVWGGRAKGAAPSAPSVDRMAKRSGGSSARTQAAAPRASGDADDRSAIAPAGRGPRKADTEPRPRPVAKPLAVPRRDPGPRPEPTMAGESKARQPRAGRPRLRDDREVDGDRPARRRRIRRPPPRQQQGRLLDGLFASHGKQGGQQAPYTGRFAEVMAALAQGRQAAALEQALAWRREHPGDVLALVALGEALTALGEPQLAARAYGSIIDLFPSRADLRRFAGQRLEALGSLGLALAADSYAEAVKQRPDHPNSHRMLAWALLRLGRHEDAFVAAAAGARRSYPSGRFRGVERILQGDLELIAAAWLAAEPKQRERIDKLLAVAGVRPARGPSLRFILSWETDANDVDFHIYDGRGAHAYYAHPNLPSGGALYADVTTGYGPECFAIDGAPQAYPYKLQIHYYRRGPMGYGMGRLQIVRHDGRGGLEIQQRPYVVMVDGAFVDLGSVGRAL